jgi:hypothetical protein
VNVDVTGGALWTASGRKFLTHNALNSAPLLQAGFDRVGTRVYDRGKAAGAWRALALAVLLWGSAAAAPAGPVEPSLWSRLQRIEAAFRAGDAQALRALLPAEAKVRVDLPGLTDGPRSYGPSQLEVVLQRAFADREGFELAFRTEDVKVAAAGTAFARARWARPGDAGPSVAPAYVTFTLRADGGVWRIHEILGSR